MSKVTITKKEKYGQGEQVREVDGNIWVITLLGSIFIISTAVVIIVAILTNNP